VPLVSILPKNLRRRASISRRLRTSEFLEFKMDTASRFGYVCRASLPPPQLVRASPLRTPRDGMRPATFLCSVSPQPLAKREPNPSAHHGPAGSLLGRSPNRNDARNLSVIAGQNETGGHRLAALQNHPSPLACQLVPGCPFRNHYLSMQQRPAGHWLNGQSFPELAHRLTDPSNRARKTINHLCNRFPFFFPRSNCRFQFSLHNSRRSRDATSPCSPASAVVSRSWL
jgi:hypothetical protein